MTRIIEPGDSYTADEEDIELRQVVPCDEPDIDVQGEPWGWTKDGPKPRGWREDGRYGPQGGEEERRIEGERYGAK
jgi:hypothetical protein